MKKNIKTVVLTTALIAVVGLGLAASNYMSDDDGAGRLRLKNTKTTTNQVDLRSNDISTIKKELSTSSYGSNTSTYSEEDEKTNAEKSYCEQECVSNTGGAGNGCGYGEDIVYPDGGGYETMEECENNCAKDCGLASY